MIFFMRIDQDLSNYLPFGIRRACGDENRPRLRGLTERERIRGLMSLDLDEDRDSRLLYLSALDRRLSLDLEFVSIIGFTIATSFTGLASSFSVKSVSSSCLRGSMVLITDEVPPTTAALGFLIGDIVNLIASRLASKIFASCSGSKFLVASSKLAS